MNKKWNEEKRRYEIKFENPFELARLLLEFNEKGRDLSFYKRWGLPRPHDAREHDDLDRDIKNGIYEYVESEEFQNLESDFKSRPSM